MAVRTTEEIKDIIKKYYKILLQEGYPVEKIFLFGSFAHNKQSENSDIDLAIIFKSIDDIIDLQIELMKMRTDEDLLIEPHPFRAIDFHISNPVVSEILKNGIEIMNHAA